MKYKENKMYDPILVFAATGKQGRAIVKQLSNAGFKVRAATRKLSTSKTKNIEGENIEIFQVDTNDLISLETAFRGVSKAFYLLPMSKNSEEIGRRIIDAAIKAGIKHLIFSSVGGADRETGIPHFESKWRIEELIRNSSVPFTIFRPAGYMEDFYRPKGAGIFLGLMKPFLPVDKKVQMISTEDIARFVRIAFKEPDNFIGKSIEIAGDSLTLSEITNQLNRITRKNIVISKWPALLVPILPKTMKDMLTFYGKDGWNADLKKMKEINPELITFNDFISRKLQKK
jgi:uncharacterized protein YbjT (DUF2867 family)